MQGAGLQFGIQLRQWSGYWLDQGVCCLGQEVLQDPLPRDSASWLQGGRGIHQSVLLASISAQATNKDIFEKMTIVYGAHACLLKQGIVSDDTNLLASDRQEA